MTLVKYFSVLLFSILFLSLVSAVPGIPHQFYGTVTVNGALANNASVVAKIDGIEYGNTLSIDGYYGYTPNLFFVEDPDGVKNDGKTIKFYVNGTEVTEYTFKSGASNELDLSLGVAPVCGDGVCNGTETCSTCAADCGACPVDNPPSNPGSSPGPGGGGGGLIVTISNKCIAEEVLVEVLLSNKKPARNATVAVILDKETLVSGKTGDEGKYIFTLETAGDYLLQVTKPGYLKKKVEFSLTDCSEEISDDTVSDENKDNIDDTPIRTCENVNCDDINPCTIDTCDAGICNFSNIEDNISCGTDGTCQKGECVYPEEDKDDKKKDTPPTTGLFGLTGLGENIAVILIVIVIAGILFFVWKRKTEEQ